VIAARGEREPPWSEEAEEVLARLGSGRDGLAEDEAGRRLAEHGPNEIEEAAGVRPPTILLRQFASPLIFILVAAAAVTLALGEYVDAAVIAAVLVLNAVLGFHQEYGAERSMEALRRLSTARARVIRGGREREVDSRVLVPGDVVHVEAGMRAPADCRVLRAAALETDESLLTGESATVAKSAEPVAADAGIGDRTSMLWMGTVVTRGHGRALVVETGGDTEFGRIAQSVSEIGEVTTPLQHRMTRFAHLVGLAVLASCAIGLTAGVAAGEDLQELVLALVALAVAAIPEGLPIVLTVALAISMRRMAARRAIVRRLPAVETLGSCTVIGSDKTGTLTENRMTVSRIEAGGRSYDVTGAGYEAAGEILLHGEPARVDEDEPLRLTLVAGALCNEASAVEADGELDVSGDPTEVALLVAASKAGFAKDQRYAATFHRGPDGALVFVKGAPEEVLAMCDSGLSGEPLDAERVLGAAEEMAASGLRVLGLATAPVDAGAGVVDGSAHVHLHGLSFLGLQGMIDPPRREAAEAVRGCREAGVRVLMITGDHAATAHAIAQQLGIAGEGDRAVTGAEVDRAGDEELERLVGETPVFARVSPEHKLRVVSALQRTGEVVAVTGDGVNDAPALKAADIGVAMGRSGTDVAKEASDMVVTDDNFASIFAAVEEGRVAFDNVRKTTFFLISTGVAAIIAVLASILFRFPAPFLAAQMIWLNVVTNGVQDVALAFEPGEKDVLERPPRPRREGIVSPLLWERTALAGLVMAAGTLALFLYELEVRDAGVERSRTVALTTMVLFQVFHVGNSRSEHLSAFAKSPFSNRFLFVGSALALALHVGALYAAPAQFVLRVEPLDLAEWARIVPVAATVIVAVELHKLLRGPGRAAARAG
jgi:calcium-translocating P-type ATPase